MMVKGKKRTQTSDPEAEDEYQGIEERDEDEDGNEQRAIEEKDEEDVQTNHLERRELEMLGDQNLA
jgi:hypothetical protein